MTSKPDSVSTLGYHWTDRTGRPLEPQVHWDATGTTLADACTQWCPSGDPLLIYIIGTHWKTTGKPLEDHWKHTGISPMALQCTLGSKFQAHWIATGLPLEDHWLRVRVGFEANVICCCYPILNKFYLIGHIVENEYKHVKYLLLAVAVSSHRSMDYLYHKIHHIPVKHYNIFISLLLGHVSNLG